MALKDTWRPRVDGVDNADSSAVNEIAEAVIQNEEDIEQNQQDISEKANVSDIYNKGAIDAMLGDKVDTTTFNETVDGVETTLDGIAEDMGNLLEEKSG